MPRFPCRSMGAKHTPHFGGTIFIVLKVGGRLKRTQAWSERVLQIVDSVLASALDVTAAQN